MPVPCSLFYGCRDDYIIPSDLSCVVFLTSEEQAICMPFKNNGINTETWANRQFGRMTKVSDILTLLSYVSIGSAGNWPSLCISSPALFFLQLELTPPVRKSLSRACVKRAKGARQKGPLLSASEPELGWPKRNRSPDRRSRSVLKAVLSYGAATDRF